LLKHDFQILHSLGLGGIIGGEVEPGHLGRLEVVLGVVVPAAVVLVLVAGMAVVGITAVSAASVSVLKIVTKL
jgi:hypothetical protein